MCKFHTLKPDVYRRRLLSNAEFVIAEMLIKAYDMTVCLIIDTKFVCNLTLNTKEQRWITYDYKRIEENGNLVVNSTLNKSLETFYLIGELNPGPIACFAKFLHLSANICSKSKQKWVIYLSHSLDPWFI